MFLVLICVWYNVVNQLKSHITTGKRNLFRTNEAAFRHLFQMIFLWKYLLLYFDFLQEIILRNDCNKYYDNLKEKSVFYIKFSSNPSHFSLQAQCIQTGTKVITRRKWWRRKEILNVNVEQIVEKNLYLLFDVACACIEHSYCCYCCNVENRKGLSAP